MRHAASLRPSENGRIGFKPPYSKRGTAAKAPSIFIGIGSIGGPSSSCGQKAFSHAIPFLEDRSDAACRVVYVDLHPGIPFLPIGKPGYCGLGRGGAERSECPPKNAPLQFYPYRLPSLSGLTAPSLHGSICIVTSTPSSRPKCSSRREVMLKASPTSIPEGSTM